MVDNREKRYKCKSCGERFLLIEDAYRHIEKHNGVVKFTDLFNPEKEW